MSAVKLDDARRVISAAEKKAREIGQPMNIAVADEGGNIVTHIRMDNAWIGSVDISMKKAGFRQTEVEDHCRQFFYREKRKMITSSESRQMMIASSAPSRTNWNTRAGMRRKTPRASRENCCRTFFAMIRRRRFVIRTTAAH